MGLMGVDIPAPSSYLDMNILTRDTEREGARVIHRLSATAADLCTTFGINSASPRFAGRNSGKPPSCIRHKGQAHSSEMGVYVK